MRSLPAVLALLCLATVSSAQTTWHVDCTSTSCSTADGSASKPFCTIQEGIQAAVDGDTVLVSPCVYTENIDFLGKSITVQSLEGPDQTRIQPELAGAIVSFISGEGPGAVIDGFRIEKARGAAGGGIRCFGSSPTITNNTIIGNTVFLWGGGIYCSYSDATIRGNRIEGNLAEYTGGGIFARYSDLTIESNLITRNITELRGAGIRTRSSSTSVIVNNTISRNMLFGTSLGLGAGVFTDASDTATLVGNLVIDNRGYDSLWGAGIYCGGSAQLVNNTIAYHRGDRGSGLHLRNTASVTVTNSIFWGNVPDSIYANSGQLTVSYSDIEGGYPGTGNIQSDPLFRDPLAGDFELDCASPAVEAGTNAPGVTMPTYDLSGADLRQIGQLDMGCDEVGTRWQLNGPPVPGQPVSFTAFASPGHPIPDASVVFLSLGDGATGGGIPVPLGGGRLLALDVDALLASWLGLTPFNQIIGLNGCSGASTVSFVIPPSAPTGVTVYYAGISWDLGKNVATSVSRTQSLVTQ